MKGRTETQDYHIARLLLLIEAFTRRGGRLDGLTKIAKLDFLLRYPVFLERLMDRRRLDWPPDAAPLSAERIAVESRMIRHKYGPWDDRYYGLIGGLIGRGLAEVVTGKGSIALRITPRGREIAARLAETQEWRPLAERAAFLKHNFDFTGNRLKDIIYNELPDVVDRPHRTVIDIDGMNEENGSAVGGRE